MAYVRLFVKCLLTHASPLCNIVNITGQYLPSYHNLIKDRGLGGVNRQDYVDAIALRFSKEITNGIIYVLILKLKSDHHSFISSEMRLITVGQIL